MPRNASGVYTLVAGNPVVANTLIESTWANTSLTDVAQAITDSLDRNGRGGMVAAFKIADGTVAAPGIAFSAESSTGFFRKAAKVLGVAISGVEVANFNQSGITLVGTAGFTSNISAPSAVLTSATDVTLASTGHALQLGASTGANLAMDGDEIQARNNGAAAPIAINALGGTVTCGGAFSAPSMKHLSGYFQMGPYNNTTYDDGSVFESYWDGPKSKLKAYKKKSDLTAVPAFIEANLITGELGSVAAPSIQFLGDADTGFYSSAINEVAVATGGINAAIFKGNGYVHFPLGISIADGSPVGPTLLQAIDTISGNATRHGIYVGLTIDGTQTFSAARTHTSGYFLATSALSIAAAAGFAEHLRGVHGQSVVGATAGAEASVNTATGGYHYALLQAGTGATVGALYGAQNYALCTNAVSATGTYGSYNWCQASSTFTGTITDAYGTYNRLDRDAGTITEAYGVYNTFEGTIGTKWGIYSNGDTYNYFTGLLSLGETNMTTVGTFKLFVNGQGAFNGAAATFRGINITTNGSRRWAFLIEDTAESATSTGGNVAIARYNNSGVFLDYPFWINRSDGSCAMTTKLYITGFTNSARLDLLDWGVGRGLGIYMKPSIAGSNTAVQFCNNTGASVGYIQCDNTTTYYFNGTSDYRLKTIYGPIDNAAEMVETMQWYEGEFKAAPGTLRHFAIAHEMQEIVPYAVIGQKDGEQMQAIEYTLLIPVLGAALQNALTRIAALEAA